MKPHIYQHEWSFGVWICESYVPTRDGLSMYTRKGFGLSPQGAYLSWDNHELDALTRWEKLEKWRTLCCMAKERRQREIANKM